MTLNTKLFWLKVSYVLCVITLLIIGYRVLVWGFAVDWGIFLSTAVLAIWIADEISTSQEQPSSNESTLETA